MTKFYIVILKKNKIVIHDIIFGKQKINMQRTRHIQGNSHKWLITNFGEKFGIETLF